MFARIDYTCFECRTCFFVVAPITAEFFLCIIFAVFVMPAPEAAALAVLFYEQPISQSVHVSPPS